VKLGWGCVSTTVVSGVGCSMTIVERGMGYVLTSVVSGVGCSMNIVERGMGYVLTSVVSGVGCSMNIVERGMGYVLTSVVSGVGCSMNIVELIGMGLYFNQYGEGCLGCGISTVVPGRGGLWGGGGGVDRYVESYCVKPLW
jgi:hypothetical protein